MWLRRAPRVITTLTSILPHTRCARVRAVRCALVRAAIKYTTDHEYCKNVDGVATVGVTAFAAEALGARSGAVRPRAHAEARATCTRAVSSPACVLRRAARAGDIVYVELPEVGAKLDQQESMGVVESVKAASDVYMPLSGEIVEVNEALNDNPALINQSPLEDGWMAKIKMSDPSELEKMMDEGEYKAFCDKEG